MSSDDDPLSIGNISLSDLVNDVETTSFSILGNKIIIASLGNDFELNVYNSSTETNVSLTDTSYSNANLNYNGTVLIARGDSTIIRETLLGELNAAIAVTAAKEAINVSTSAEKDRVDGIMEGYEIELDNVSTINASELNTLGVSNDTDGNGPSYSYYSNYNYLATDYNNKNSNATSYESNELDAAINDYNAKNTTYQDYVTNVSTYTADVSTYTAIVSTYTANVSIYNASVSIYTASVSTYTANVSIYNASVSTYGNDVTNYTTEYDFWDGYSSAYEDYNYWVGRYNTYKNQYYTAISQYDYYNDEAAASKKRRDRKNKITNRSDWNKHDREMRYYLEQAELALGRGNTAQDNANDARTKYDGYKAEMNEYGTSASLATAIINRDNNESYLATAKTNLATANTNLATANTNLATAKSDLATAESNLSTAESNLSTAESNLSTAETGRDNALDPKIIAEYTLGELNDVDGTTRTHSGITYTSIYGIYNGLVSLATDAKTARDNYDTNTLQKQIGDYNTANADYIAALGVYTNYLSVTSAAKAAYNTTNAEYNAALADQTTKLNNYDNLGTSNKTDLEYITIGNEGLENIGILHVGLIDNSVYIISMSEDGTRVLVSENNTVYFYIVENGSVNPPLTVYNSGNDVKSISLSGDGTHIAIGLSHTDLTTFSVNIGKVITFIVIEDEEVFVEESGSIIGKNGGERAGESVYLNTSGTELIVGVPGYRRFIESLSYNRARNNNGAVRKYTYNGGWVEEFTIYNPDDSDTSGTFGSNVILSPDANSIIISDTDNGVYYKKNGVNIVGVADSNSTAYKVQFVGNDPFYITNTEIKIIISWRAQNINEGITSGTDDRFYVTSLSRDGTKDGTKLAVSQHEQLGDSDTLVMIYTLVDGVWVYNSNISVNDLQSDYTPDGFVFDTYKDNNVMNHKLSGDGNTFVYSFKTVSDSDPGYIYVFKQDDEDNWNVTAVLEEGKDVINRTYFENYLSDISITNDGKIIAVSTDDRSANGSVIDIFLLNDDGEHINADNETYDATSFKTRNILITKVDNGFTLALNGDATLDSPWVTLAVSSVSSDYITIYKIPKSIIDRAYISQVTHATLNTRSTYSSLTLNGSTPVSSALVDYSSINTHYMDMSGYDSGNTYYNHTIDISDNGETIALSRINDSDKDENYTVVITSTTSDGDIVTYTATNILYDSGEDTDTHHNTEGLNWGWHLKISGDGSTIVMATRYGAYIAATETNPYVIVYEYISGGWRRIDYGFTSVSLFDTHNVPSKTGQNAYPSISSDGKTIAAGIYYTDETDSIPPYVLVYSNEGTSVLDTNTDIIEYNKLNVSTSDVVISSTTKILSLSSNSYFIAIATRFNVHLYGSVHYEYVYDLLSDGKKYIDIFNVTLNPNGGYIAIEYFTSISIFSIQNNNMVLMITIDNNYVNSRDLVWTNGKLVIGTQNGIILYDLTSRNVNNYINVSTIYRIVDDSYVFNYNGTLNLYHYVNKTSTEYQIDTSLDALQHFPGQTDKIVAGFPDERKIIIYTLTSSVPSEEIITNVLYSGFGKEIVIKSFSDSITRIFVSSDNYIHVYDYASDQYTYYLPIVKDDVIQVKYDATGIFILNDERKSLSFKSI